MHRAIRQSSLLQSIGRRTFQTTACWCESSSSSSSTPYSLPHDAYTSPSSSTSSSSTSSSSSASSAITTRTTTTLRSSRPRQKQFLTDSEAQAFADLLGEILPNSSATRPPSSKSTTGTSSSGGGGVFDLFGNSNLNERKEPGGGIDRIQTALQKKMEKKFSSKSSDDSFTSKRSVAVQQERSLTPTEELELDKLREEMFLIKDEETLLNWSLVNVFGLPSSSTPFMDSNVFDGQKIPNPRLYPLLLLNLFLILKDNFNSTFSALKIFKFASSNPYSYILGCSSKLYLEVLKTRWFQSQGDVEGVLEGFEGMRSGGVRVGIQEEEGFKDLVREIGESIRIDRERAELVVQALEEEGEFGVGGLDEREREREVQKRKWFGDKESVRLWRRMEKILEDHLDEQEEIRRNRLDDRFRMEEISDRDRRGLEGEEEEEIDFGSREEDSLLGVKPSLFSHRGDSSSGSKVPSTRTHLHSSTRRSGLSPFENVKPRRKEEEEEDWYDFNRGLKHWKQRDSEKGLPKRPSFANPYKIRRQSLLKSEKSRRDEKHPMLFWKQ
ncbi:hypothetical protein JCM3765_002517 [Sporobolomyces pararoseus]